MWVKISLAPEYHFNSRLHPGLHAVPVRLRPVHFQVVAHGLHDLAHEVAEERLVVYTRTDAHDCVVEGQFLVAQPGRLLPPAL